jgi:hypothetical protein
LLFFILSLVLDWISKFLAAEYQKILNLQNSFVDREHAHNSVLNFVTFFTLGGIVLGFAQNSFEKWLVAASRFSKKFYANQKNVPTNSTY